MSISRDILTANRRFYTNYRGATTTKGEVLVMREGVVVSNEWYIAKVGCFLLDLLQKRQKRGGVNEW